MGSEVSNHLTWKQWMGTKHSISLPQKEADASIKWNLKEPGLNKQKLVGSWHSWALSLPARGCCSCSWFRLVQSMMRKANDTDTHWVINSQKLCRVRKYRLQMVGSLRVLCKSNSCLSPIASHIGQRWRQIVRLNSLFRLLPVYKCICAHTHTDAHYIWIYTHSAWYVCRD